MRWTTAQLADYEARRRVANPNVLVKDATPVAHEKELHEQIIAWCDLQWPKVKYRHSRMDKATREELGTEDFTLFLAGGKTLHVEAKNNRGKLTPEQQAWKAQMEMLGHQVWTVRSFEDFLALVRAA